MDDYVRKIAQHIHVRIEDNLLIRIPNTAYRLNPTAAKMLRFLLDGGTVADILARYPGREDAVAQDIHHFACDLRALLKGCWTEGESRRAIELVPFTMPYSALPVLSELAVTYRCNLACRFCYAGCGTAPRRDELSTRNLCRVIDRIRRDADVPSVSFTGGEPTLHPDLPALVRHASTLGMWTNLITNGTQLTPRLVAALRAAGLDSVQISIEGADEATHDAIVGQAGAFAAAMAGLDRVRAAGLRVHTNTTICALNRDAVPAIVAMTQALGLERLSMNMLMPCGSARGSLAELLITYRDIGAVVLAAQRQAAALGIEFMWYSPTPLCVFNPIAHRLGNKGCAACDGLLSIAPNGDVLPCSSWPRPVGNMLRDDFRTLWRGAAAAGIRAKEHAPAACHDCDDLPACTGACPLYWSVVGEAELAEAGRVAACR